MSSFMATSGDLNFWYSDVGMVHAYQPELEQTSSTIPGLWVIVFFPVKKVPRYVGP